MSPCYAKDWSSRLSVLGKIYKAETQSCLNMSRTMSLVKHLLWHVRPNLEICGIVRAENILRAFVWHPVHLDYQLVLTLSPNRSTTMLKDHHGLFIPRRSTDDHHPTTANYSVQEHPHESACANGIELARHRRMRTRAHIKQCQHRMSEAT